MAQKSNGTDSVSDLGVSMSEKLSAQRETLWLGFSKQPKTFSRLGCKVVMFANMC